MSIKSRLVETVEDAKALRRGERRTAPAGTRGRVYERKHSVPTEQPFNSVAVPARGKLTATACVFRAETGEYEHYRLIDGQAIRYYPGEGTVGWFKGLKARVTAFFKRN